MKAEINKHGCLVLTTTTVLEEKQLSDWLKINSGVVMNYAFDVNSEVNGIETRKDKCTLHIVSNNEALENFCNKIISEIEALKLASINGKRGGDYRIALTHAIQTINGNLLEASEGNHDADTESGLHLQSVNARFSKEQSHEVRKLCRDFYLWMQANDYDHNIPMRVENKAELFLREKNVR